MSDEQFRPGPPPEPPSEGSAHGSRPDETSVVCPRCWRTTDSLKVNEIPNIVFLAVYIAWNHDTVVACPACMRSALAKRCAAAIPLTNILFPAIAVVYVAYYLGTFAKGHSSQAVAAAHARTRAEVLAQQNAAINLRKPPRREWIILTILIALIAGVWIAGLAWTPSPPSPVIEGRTAAEWIQQLQGGAPVARMEAAGALGRGGEAARSAIAALRDVALHDPDPRARQAAYRALVAIDAQSVQDLPFPGFVPWQGRD
jgi:HEAT repeat protein